MNPLDIKSARLRLGLSEHRVARLANVSTRNWLRWERGEARPPPVLVRYLSLLELVSRDAPDLWKRLFYSVPNIHKDGRPIGSKNLPKWMMPARKPRRNSGRPVGRPRRPGSEGPKRHKCVGFKRLLDVRNWPDCGVTVYGGGTRCPDCLAGQKADIAEYNRVMRERGAQLIVAERAAQPAAAGVVICSIPSCGKPVIGHGLICANCRHELGMPLRHEMYE